MNKGMKREYGKGPIYWRSLALILFIACLPALLIGIGIYTFGSQSIVSELNDTHQAQVSQSIERLDEKLAELEQFAAKLAFRQEFNESLEKMNFSEQFLQTRYFFRSLSLLKADNPLIYDVGFYVSGSEKLLSDQWGVRSAADPETLALIRPWFESRRQIIWSETMPKWSPKDSPMKGIVTKRYAEGSDRAYGAFLVYLNQSSLNQLIQRLGTRGGSAFIINGSGNVLAANEKSDPALQKEMIRRMQTDRAEKRTFVYRWEGEKYSVSVDRLYRLGEEWIYISATPLSQITKSVTTMSRVIVIISASGLVLALALSWFASRRIYDPIRRVAELFLPGKDVEEASRLNEFSLIERQWRTHLQEREQLDQRLRESLPMLREGFLLQLLYGRLYPTTNDEMIEKLRQYGWNIEGKRYALLVAGLYGNDASHIRMMDHEDQLIEYAASNVISELCEPEAEYSHMINFQNATIGVVLVFDGEVPAAHTKSKLLALAGNIACTISGMLKRNTAVAVSKTTDTVLDLPGLFEETAGILRLRDPNNQAVVLDVEYMMPAVGRYSEFPLELEQDIIHSMRLGFEEAAVTGVHRFVDALLQKPNTQMHVQQGMLKLLGSAYDATLRSGMNPDIVYGGAHLYEELLSARHPDEMAAWFARSVIVPFTRAVSAAMDPELWRIVERVAECVNDELTTDVSLDMYADRFQISPFKLSRAFKQVKGVNFIDYLTVLRIEKCKELLLVSDMKINDIAETLRYRPSYLIRLFKKNTGMTPGQYREKHALNEEASQIP